MAHSVLNVQLAAATRRIKCCNILVYTVCFKAVKLATIASKLILSFDSFYRYLEQ